MSGIMALPKQSLAAMDVAGVRPDEAGSVRAGRIPQVEFNGHLADLEHQEAKPNALVSSNEDFGSCPPNFADQDFLRAPQQRAERKSHFPLLALAEVFKAELSEPAAPSAANSGTGSSGEVTSGTRSLPACMLGAAAAMPEVSRFSASGEKSSSEASSRALAVAIHQFTQASMLHRPSRPQAYSAQAALPFGPAAHLSRNGGLSNSRPGGENPRMAGNQNGDLLQTSKPDLLSVVGQDGVPTRTIAEVPLAESEIKGFQNANVQQLSAAPVRFSRAEIAGLNHRVIGESNLDERAISRDWSRNLNSAALVSVISISQETHLPLGRGHALSLGSPQLPLGSGAEVRANSAAAGDAQLQPTNEDNEMGSAPPQGNPVAMTSGEGKEKQDSGADRAVNNPTLALEDKDDVFSAWGRSAAANIPSFSPGCSLAGIFGDPGVQEKNCLQPERRGFNGRSAAVSGNDSGVSVSQTKRGDFQFTVFGQITESGIREETDVVPGIDFSIAKHISSSHQHSLCSSPVWGSANAVDNSEQITNQELRQRFSGSNTDTFAAGQKGVQTADENSALPVSIFAGDEPPLFAAPPSAAVLITQSATGSSGIGGSSTKTALAQSHPTIGVAAESAPFSTQVRVLNLQLEPENLGRVIVKLRLSGPRLTLQVDAERPDTLRLIGDDEKLLSERLKSAGYAIESLAIRTVDSHASNFGQEAAAGSSQKQNGSNADGGSTFHDRPSMGDANSPPPQSLECDVPNTAGAHPIDTELYL